MDGMPYSYNKAIADHPDMKEFVEGVWLAGERKMARIAELEAALRPFADAVTYNSDGNTKIHPVERDAYLQADALLHSNRSRAL